MAASPHETWHEGELKCQQRAGVKNADRLRSMIMKAMPPVAMEFLAQQELAAFGTLDEEGWPTAWVLMGPAGFLQARDETTLHVAKEAIEALDPRFAKHLCERAEIGTLAIEPRTRRRMRINGRARLDAEHGLFIDADEVFSNCPKYIQAREPAVQWTEVPTLTSGKASRELSLEDRLFLEQADTFFIASNHREAGVDVSHRGGRPGFLQVVDAKRFCFPDYAGNNMFQTLGNLVLDDRAGLAVLDFERAELLQIEGRARIDEDPERVASFDRARRVIEFEVRTVTRSAWPAGTTWTPAEFSPALPAEPLG